MGHAPPRSPGELRRIKERQQARQAWMERHVPPGRILEWGLYATSAGLLVASQAWVLLVIIVLLIALVKSPQVERAVKRSKAGNPPRAPEERFRQEFMADERSCEEALPELELELDYGLGLKQRPGMDILAMVGGLPAPERAESYGLWQVAPPRREDRPKGLPPRLLLPSEPREPTAKVVFVGPGEQVLSHKQAVSEAQAAYGRLGTDRSGE